MLSLFLFMSSVLLFLIILIVLDEIHYSLFSEHLQERKKVKKITNKLDRILGEI